jgi:hypothetical protein
MLCNPRDIFRNDSHLKEAQNVQVLADILSVFIFFPFSINDIFYVIPFLHSLTGHDEGGSSSHRNEHTPRDSSDHSNQSSDGNT